MTCVKPLRETLFLHDFQHLVRMGVLPSLPAHIPSSSSEESEGASADCCDDDLAAALSSDMAVPCPSE